MSLAASASRPRLSGRDWTLLVLVDLLVLASLPISLWVSASVLALLALVWFLPRGPIALGLVLHGMPLFWPLELAGVSADQLFLRQILVLVPVLALAWTQVWDIATPRERETGLDRALRSPVFLLTVVLALWLWVRSLGTPAPEYGRSKALLFSLLNVWLLLGTLVLLDRGGSTRSSVAAGGRGESPSDTGPVAHRPLRRMLQVSLVLIAAVAIVAIWNSISGYWSYAARLRVLGLNPIWMARLLGTGLLLVAAGPCFGFRSRSGRLLVAILLGVPFYLSGSRGPLLAFGLAWAFWWTWGGNPRRRWGLAVTVGLALVALVAAFEFGLLAGNSPFAGHEVSNVARLYLLRTVWEQGLTPGWFGHGTGSFPAVGGLGDMRLYPHNVFLELWVETGVLGVALFLVWLGVVARGAVRALRLPASRVSLVPDRDLVRLAAAVFVFSFINAQMSGDLPVNELLWCWGGILVLVSRPGTR